MANYLSLALGAATCGAAFLWMMIRIRRSEKRKIERQKASAAAAGVGSIGVSSTVQYAESKELVHSR